MKHLILTTLMVLSVSLGAAKAYIDHQLNLNLERWKNLLTQEAKINYQSISTSLRGSIVIKRLNLIPLRFFPVDMDEIILHKAYQFYSTPQDLSLSIRGLSIPISDMSWIADDSWIRGLKQAGYFPFLADITLDAHLKGSHLHTFLIIEASKWGKVELSLDLDQVPPFTRWISSAIIPQFLFVALKLTYSDRGLVNRLFTQLAQDHTMTLEGFKQALISQLVFYLGKENQEKLQAFIDSPKTLTVQWQPHPPLAVSDLWMAFPKQLDLKVM